MKASATGGTCLQKADPSTTRSKPLIIWYLVFEDTAMKTPANLHKIPRENSLLNNKMLLEVEIKARSYLEITTQLKDYLVAYPIMQHSWKLEVQQLLLRARLSYISCM